MREIKFRAWDGKAMGKPFNLEWFKEGSNLPEDWNPELGKWEVNAIFMQFTGLKDRNGKEIYEGDIVEAEGKEGKQQFKVFWYRAGVWSIHNVAVSDTFWREDDQLRQFEVIGNIYENPELLTK